MNAVSGLNQLVRSVCSAVLSAEGFVDVRYRSSVDPEVFFRRQVNDVIEHYISFRLLHPPRSGSSSCEVQLEPSLGIEAVGVRPSLGGMLRTFAHGIVPISKLLNKVQTPCLCTFPLSRYLEEQGEDEFLVGDESDLVSGLNLVLDRVYRPLLADVDDYEGALRVLISESAPFQWWQTPALGRLTQIAYLSSRCQLGLRLQAIRTIREKTDYLSSDAFARYSDHGLIERLVESAGEV